VACQVDTTGPLLCSSYAGCVGIGQDIIEEGALMMFRWTKGTIQQSCTLHITDISSLGAFAKLRK
jgi:hypothetical protein